MNATDDTVLIDIARALCFDERGDNFHEVTNPPVRGDYLRLAAAVLPVIRAEVAKARADALRDAADDPALRLTGHSGISITRLRARALEG